MVTFGDQCLNTRRRLLTLRTPVSTVSAKEAAALPRCPESLDLQLGLCPGCLLATAPGHPSHGIQGLEVSVEKAEVHLGFPGLCRALCCQAEEPKLFLNWLAGK